MGGFINHYLRFTEEDDGSYTGGAVCGVSLPGPKKFRRGTERIQAVSCRACLKIIQKEAKRKTGKEDPRLATIDKLKKMREPVREEKVTNTGILYTSSPETVRNRKDTKWCTVIGIQMDAQGWWLCGYGMGVAAFLHWTPEGVAYASGALTFSSMNLDPKTWRKVFNELYTELLEV